MGSKESSILTWILDIPWIDNTHVSLSCEWGKSECVFQFWKDSEEQFYCELSECTQTSKHHAIKCLCSASYIEFIQLLGKMTFKAIVQKQVVVA